MFLSTGIVAVFYALMGVVAAGVLPHRGGCRQDARSLREGDFPDSHLPVLRNRRRAVCAGNHLKRHPSWITKGLYVASKEGWFPESLADTNKHGVPYKLLLIFFVIGAVPIVTGMDVSFISPWAWASP